MYFCLVPSPSEQYWDAYVKSLPREAGFWPVDEAYDQDDLPRLFAHVREHCDLSEWHQVAEIGPGAGRFTALLLNECPTLKILAFDISLAFLELLQQRFPREQVVPIHLQSARADEMLLAMEQRKVIGRVDSMVAIDSLEWVPLQIAMAYLVTAAVTLRRGGKLVFTLPDAETERGFRALASWTTESYEQSKPNALLAWSSKSLIRSVLSRLGFHIDVVENWAANPALISDSRLMFVVATLVDPAPGKAVSWILQDANDVIDVESHAATAPSFQWTPDKLTLGYRFELSSERFVSLEWACDLSRDACACVIPNEVWSGITRGREHMWHVLSEREHRRIRVAGGTVVRT